MKIVARVFLFISLIIPTLLLIIGCSSWPTVEGSGELETREIDCNIFTKIEISDAFEADIIQAESSSVRITTDDNLFPYLEAKQDGYTLNVGVKPNHKYLNTTQKVRIEMPKLALQGLKISGASKVYVSGFANYSCPVEFELSEASSLNLSGLKAKIVKFKISGTSQVMGGIVLDYGMFHLSEGSKIELEGWADIDVMIYASDSSRVELAKFPINDALVNLSGASVATINASRNLSGNLIGGSTLYYVGNPILDDLNASECSIITAMHPVEPSELAEPSIPIIKKNGEWSTFTISVPEYYERATLEEIPTLIGGRIPVPTYLPKGCDIKEVYVGEVRYGEGATVLLIISDRDIKHIGSEVECLMYLQITWPAGPGLKITGEMYRRWNEKNPYRTSAWQSFIPEEEISYEAWLYSTKNMSNEERQKIKQSMSYIPPQPPPDPLTELVGPPRVEGLVEPKPEYETLDYCGQYFPEGLRLLTDAEKESVIELALEEYQKGPQDPYIQERLKDKDITNYTVSEVIWYGIEWGDLDRTEIQTTREYPYWVAETGVLNCIPPEDLEFGYYVLPGLSEEAVFYPSVSIAVAESFISLEVVVDLDEGIILSSWLHVPHS